MQLIRQVHLFRMRDYLRDVDGVALDREVESPIQIDSCLPNISGLVEFLCSQRRVPQVFSQQIDLFVECLSHVRWGTLTRLKSMRAEYDIHLAMRLRSLDFPFYELAQFHAAFEGATKLAFFNLLQAGFRIR